MNFETASIALEGRVIWSQATFTLATGEFVGLIGPNGTGKTTLLRVLLGQVPLFAGRLRVMGRSPARGNPAIGYVPQRRSLVSDLAVRGYDLGCSVWLATNGASVRLPPPRGGPSTRRSKPWALLPTPINRSACFQAVSSSDCSSPRRC